VLLVGRGGPGKRGTHNKEMRSEWMPLPKTEGSGSLGYVEGLVKERKGIFKKKEQN
jgi:hypothetical protein